MTTTHDTNPAAHRFIVIAAWAAVGAPLLWGVAETIKKALALFR